MAGVCGRDCGNCGFREEYGCKGCLETEGRPVWGECGVVSCCHGRGLQNCGECPSSAGCAALEDICPRRDRWPQEEAERRRREAEREAVRREKMARQAPVLAKWLVVVFWAGIANMGLNLLGKLKLGVGADLVLNLLSIAASVVVLVAYWKFSKLSERFRMVWIWELVSIVMLVAAVLLMLVSMNNMYSLLSITVVLMIGALILSAVIIYQFCQGMWEVLDGEDQHLADNWLLLRKWTLGSLAAFAGCVLLIFILSVFGALLMVGAALVLAGCSIAELVLTWKSARFFREAAERTALPSPEL